METLAIYWLKVNTVVSILFLTYFLLLKNEKFFTLNRVFLIGSLVLALLMPILPAFNTPGLHQLQRGVTRLNPLHSLYSNFSIVSNTNINNASAVHDPHQAVSSPYNFISALTAKEILFGLYALVTLILLIRFVFQLLHLFILIRKTKTKVTDGIHYCEHDEELSPFSFFHHLVINKSQYNPEQLRQIVLHEKVHIKQFHTVDILAAEIVHLLLWINPIMIFFKQYVKINLEYLADEHVLDAGIDRKSYQFSILQTCLHTETYPLTNLFNSSKLKLRIKMMNSKRKSLAHLYKYTIVLPLIFASYLVIHPGFAQGLSLTKNQQQQLKSLEGKYRMSNGTKAFFLQITAKGNELVLKQLWDNQEIIFEPQSELEFKAKNQDFPIKFIKGKNGTIAQMLAFQRDLWDKIDAEPQEEIVFTQQQLNAFAGYYQYQNRKEAFAQIVVRGKNLVGIQLWDNKEFVFTAKSSLEFISKEGIPIKFIKNAAGAITQLLVLNRDWLDKVKEYKPIKKKEVELTAQQLEITEGYYFQQENKEYCMQITAKGNEILVKQLWDDAEANFFPVSELEFFSKASMLTFTFTKGENGQITQLTARDGKLWTKGPKPREKQMVALSSENLKAFEGKYSLPYEGNVVYMEVTPTEDGLLLKQLWDGAQINFFPISDLEFYNKKKAFPLKFIKKDGRVAQVEAYHKDLWSRVN
jgi:beta-lactamase regulating signal transducer with metallopeptidase domain